MKDKIKCYLCHDHFDRIPHDPCSSCPSVKQHEDVCKILSRQDLEDTPMNRMMLGEVRSIRMVLEGFDGRFKQLDEKVEEFDHAIHGNGNPGMKTELAVIREAVNENKGRALNLFTTATACIAVIGAIAALLK